VWTAAVMPAAIAVAFCAFWNVTCGWSYASMKGLRDWFFALGWKTWYDQAIRSFGYGSETKFFKSGRSRGHHVAFRRHRMHAALALAFAVQSSACLCSCKSCMLDLL